MNETDDRSRRQPKIVAIIQARMGSTRLPGKVLAEIHGRPMLWHVVERTRAARHANEVIVATTNVTADDAIVEWCHQQKIVCFRGSEEDVLDRYYQAATQHQADIVVRITSDCPLIDGEIVDKVLREFSVGHFDYASNGIARTYPRGLDTEVMTYAALERAHATANQPYQRAHVTPFIYENPKLFSILSVTSMEDYSSYRWTVDTPEDLGFVRTVYDRIGRDDCKWTEVMDLLQREPQLAQINGSVPQKALHEG